MDNAKRKEIEQECRDLVVQLCHYSDHKEHQKATNMFIPEGVWIRGGKPYSGHDEIMKSFTGRSTTTFGRHCTANTLITVEDDDHASGVTYYVLYNHDPKTDNPEFPLPLVPFSMGEWHDKYVRTPEGWKFAHREVKRFFQKQ